MGMRVWVNEWCAVALRPGLLRKAGMRRAEVISKSNIPGYRVWEAPSQVGDDVDSLSRRRVRLRAVVQEMADLDSWRPWSRSQRTCGPCTTSFWPWRWEIGCPVDEGDPLELLVAEFRVDWNYPTPDERTGPIVSVATLPEPDNIGLSDS